MLGDITNRTATEQDSEAGGEEESSEGAGEGVGKQVTRKEGVDPAKLKISYEQYKRLRNMIVLHMREDQEKVVNIEEWEGIKQSDLVDW